MVTRVGREALPWPGRVTPGGHMTRRNRAAATLLTLSTVFGSQVLPAQAAELEWDLELLSMDLNATGALMPLGPGWGPIRTDIHVGESQALGSVGHAAANRVENGGGGPIQEGDLFEVGSFFDVFFDITITDVDPQSDFPGLPAGAQLNFAGNGPLRLQTLYSVEARLNQPNFGLFPPPESAPYLGFGGLEIPLGGDFNGNGEPDKIKLGVVTLTVVGANRTFITLPDGMVIDAFDAIMNLSGAVVDLSQDPPFGPIILAGPTTASSHLQGPGPVPEPMPLVLLLLGLGGAALSRARQVGDHGV